jgi:hypothetical protein
LTSANGAEPYITVKSVEHRTSQIPILGTGKDPKLLVGAFGFSIANNLCICFKMACDLFSN